jgi:hypothetical protein
MAVELWIYLGPLGDNPEGTVQEARLPSTLGRPFLPTILVRPTQEE